MRILRGVSSRRLPCGCLIGIYETYDRQVVAIVDRRNDACRDVKHVAGKVVAVPESRDAVTQSRDSGS